MNNMYICVDFDGTMVDHCYPQVGQPVPGAVDWCKIFQNEGASIILWTMRSGNELMEAAEYMRGNDIDLFGINENPSQRSWSQSPKAYGHIYIDDAAAGCSLMMIEGFNRKCVDWGDMGPMVLRMMKNG